MLHPEEYARHVLRDLRDFFKGEITYPEIDLRLAGEEAWSDAFPELREAIHNIIKTIRRTVKEYGVADGQPIPRYVLADIFVRILPYIRVVMKFAKGEASEEKIYDKEVYEVYGGNLSFA